MLIISSIPTTRSNTNKIEIASTGRSASPPKIGRCHCLINKNTAAKTSLLNDQNEDLEKLQNELRKVQKELQEYKINDVGKQQQQFIQ